MPWREGYCTLKRAAGAGGVAATAAGCGWAGLTRRSRYDHPRSAE